MSDMSDNVKSIQQVLRETGIYVGPTAGTSMLPMLKNRRDTIVVKAKTERLKPLDVALYMRGDLYILHRVLKVTKDGYIIRGDNCYVDEIVPEETVIGVLTEFFRKNEHYYCNDKKYLDYARRRVAHYKARRFFVLTWRKILVCIKKPIKWILRWDKRQK